MRNFFYRVVGAVCFCGFLLHGDAQERIDSLKQVLEKDLQGFIEAKRGVDSLDYIDASVFKRLLDSINIETTPLLYGIDSFEGVSISLGLNMSHTLFAYSYSNYSNPTDMEFYYKNCTNSARYNWYKLRNEKPLVVGIPSWYPLVAIDTISNVIITRPIRSRYTIETSRLVKDSAEEGVKGDILGRYQVKIFIWGNNVIANFIAPPSPKSKIRVEVKVSGDKF